MINIASWFKRKQPLWQQKDDSARAEGVTRSKDPALLEQLEAIASNDASAMVRLRALARLDDLDALIKINAGDADSKVREAAQKRIREMFTGTTACKQSEQECASLIGTLADRGLLEHVLKTAQSRALRSAALEKLDRPALYKQCAIGDADPELRRFALARVRDANALKAIAEATRKTDKALSKQATSLLESLKFNAGDPATLRARALGLCERLETLVRSVERAEAPVLALREEWRALGAINDEGLTRRFEGALVTLRETIDAPKLREELLEEQKRARTDICAHLLAAAGDPAEDIDLERRIGSLDQLIKLSHGAWKQVGGQAGPALSAEFEAALAGAHARLVELVQARPADPQISGYANALGRLLGRRELSERDLNGELEKIVNLGQTLAKTASNEVALRGLREQVEQARQLINSKSDRAKALALEVEGLIEQLASLIESGDSKSALALDLRIQNAHNSVRPAKLLLSQAAQKRLLALEGDLTELKKWRGWSNASARERLLEEAGALKAAILHPDALQEKVRELREQWRAVESRKRDQESEQGQAFNALLEEALKPAQAYFDKRNALQNKQLLSSRALLEQLTGLPESIEDWRAVSELVKLGREDLRDIDRLPPKVRGRHAKALRDALDVVSKRIDGYFDELGAQREKLIASAEALGSHSDSRAAIATVKALSERWKEIKGLPRKRDQAYWLRFRAALDQVFAHADAQRNQVRAEQTKSVEQQNELIEQARGLNSAPDVRKRIQEIRASASDLGLAPRELERELDNALERIEATEAQARHAAVLTGLDALKAKLAAKRQQLAIDEMPATRREWDDALAHQAPREPATALATTLLIELELIASVPSAEVDREQRMDLNVARLAKRMRGELKGSPLEQAIAQSARYLEIEMGSEDAAPLDARLMAALEAILK